MASEREKRPLTPTALSPSDLAKLLSKVGGNAVTEEMLQSDVEAGAPVNADGTFNLVHYCAWLVKAMAETGDLRYAD